MNRFSLSMMSLVISVGCAVPRSPADSGLTNPEMTSCPDITFGTPGPTVDGQDSDHDGYLDWVDCDDDDPATHPGAEEIWYDGQDEDCRGGDDWDQDGDGVATTDNPPDCNDIDAAIYPGALDIAGDDVDQDCIYGDLLDADQDGYSFKVDCDEADPSVHPNAVENHYDGVDYDCNGVADDYDADGFPWVMDCQDVDASIHPGAPEIPGDGIDQDCIYGDLVFPPADLDGDGFPVEVDCDEGNPYVHPGALELWYDDVDQDCAGGDDWDQDSDGWPIPDDCDDTNPAIFPGAGEVPDDGIDQDCDWSDVKVPALVDGDGDGYLDFVDCNDADPAVHPGADDILDDGVDQDCDGTEQVTPGPDTIASVYLWTPNLEGSGICDGFPSTEYVHAIDVSAGSAGIVSQTTSWPVRLTWSGATPVTIPALGVLVPAASGEVYFNPWQSIDIRFCDAFECSTSVFLETQDLGARADCVSQEVSGMFSDAPDWTASDGEAYGVSNVDGDYTLHYSCTDSAPVPACEGAVEGPECLIYGCECDLVGWDAISANELVYDASLPVLTAPWFADRWETGGLHAVHDGNTVFRLYTEVAPSDEGVIFRPVIDMRTSWNGTWAMDPGSDGWEGPPVFKNAINDFIAPSDGFWPLMWEIAPDPADTDLWMLPIWNVVVLPGGENGRVSLRNLMFEGCGADVAPVECDLGSCSYDLAPASGVELCFDAFDGSFATFEAQVRNDTTGDQTMWFSGVPLGMVDSEGDCFRYEAASPGDVVEVNGDDPSNNWWYLVFGDPPAAHASVTANGVPCTLSPNGGGGGDYSCTVGMQ